MTRMCVIHSSDCYNYTMYTLYTIILYTVSIYRLIG